MMVFLNPFKANALFLYPLKKSENLWFLDVFKRYRNEALVQRYTNADLKIYRYLCLHIKMICLGFCIIAAFTF